MPSYEFRCVQGCVFDASYAMSQVPAEVACPRCGDSARRRISAPHLSRADSAAFQTIDRSARSAHEPDVVTALPGGAAGRRARPITDNPLHRRLPRP